MKIRFAIILAAIAAALLPSCDDSDQHTHNPTVYNIVELASRDEYGTVFHYYPAPGNVPQALVAKTRSAVDAEPGECVFLGYTETGEPGEDGVPVAVKSVARILNTQAKIATEEELRGWDAEPIRLLAIWRAGEKIILRCLLTADESPRYFGLLIDEATLADQVPTAYIYHRRDNPAPNYTSQYYTAFSLAPLLHPADGQEAPAYTALRVRFANAADPSLSEMTIPL